jgi:hypothetical protein
MIPAIVLSLVLQHSDARTTSRLYTRFPKLFFALRTSADGALVQNVTNSPQRLDKDFHLGTWSRGKECKFPEEPYGYDCINDPHRYLSEMVCLDPGYSISFFLKVFSDSTIQDAVRQKLYDCGNSDGTNTNVGWAQVRR